MYRGDIFFVDLGEGVGCEQRGKRPVVIISNDIGNKYSPIVTVATLTSSSIKKMLPTHVAIDREEYNTPRDCTILVEQTRAISKERITGKKLFSLNAADITRLNKAILVSLGLNIEYQDKKYA